MTLIPSLGISLIDDNLVSITRGVGVDDATWQEVCSWWNASTSAHIDDSFHIEMHTFLLRIEYLRSVWSRNGSRSFQITEVLKNRILNARASQVRLENLLQSERELHSIELGELGLARSLTEEQLENVSRLVMMENGANFSVPGAGKTFCQLVVWRWLNIRGNVGNLLVICPRSAFEAWSAEPGLSFTQPPQAQTFGFEPIQPRTEILISNYEQLENDQKLGRLRRWVLDNQSLIVLDEAHRLKGGAGSVRWRACRELVADAPRVDLLTGTPMPQSFEDLRNLLALSWSEIPRSFFSDARLQSLKRGSMFVRTTKTELNLPDLKVVEERLPPGRIQEQIYSALRRMYVGQFSLSSADESALGRRGRAVMSLIAAATNPGLLMGLSVEDSYLNLQWPPREVQSSEKLMNVLASYAENEMPPKYQWVSRFVDVASRENRKVLVWSTFVGNLRALQRLLAPYDPVMIHGATPLDDREREIQRFRNDPSCSVLITNPQTLGEGISLHQVCHDAVYVDRSYNAGLYLQSIDRIHRLGLSPEQETRVFLLSTEGTIDQRVSLRLEAKIRRLAAAMDDSDLVRVSLPDEELILDSAAVLGIDSIDLDDLFEHLRV